ncbi:hypothetical protein NONO_c22440 [Nocardia nova SH22a]|uniref:Uncharacterized protein n=1 Tax=Nocardia nova SH22a TaxID=1415166 RepID=W5TCR3_9NOCA|nr:hypothetical protein [Nocardia nova]AHH17042.1 hypothetical protein NONO_c22440 [Nocardia nova SH22a]
MIVDWEVYYDAARKCHDLADELRKADRPVHEAAKGDCRKMAGDAPGCSDWGRAYDDVSHRTLQACASLANALTNYGAVLYAQGYNWGIANKSNPPPPRPDTGQVGEYKVSLPSAVGDNGDGYEKKGGLQGFFNDLSAKLIQVFGKLPNGNSHGLRTAHDTWSAFAANKTITNAAATVSAVSALFDGMGDDGHRERIQDYFTSLKNSADTVATAAGNITAPIDSYRQATDDLRSHATEAINKLTTAFVVTAAVGGALSVFTLGAAEVGVAAEVTEAVSATVEAIERAYHAAELSKSIGDVHDAQRKITAFEPVPATDLDKAINALTSIIGMRALLIDDHGAAVSPSNSPGTPEYSRRLEELAKDAAKNGKITKQSRREAEVGLSAEHNGLIPGPITRAKPGPNGEDQGEFTDSSGQRWDVKSSPDFQPSYRKTPGMPIPPQSDEKFVDMINDDIADGEHIILDPDGMSPDRKAHLEDLVKNNPNWRGKVVWSQ